MQAIEFLQWWRPSGILTLSAIAQDGSIETQSWKIRDNWDNIESWVSDRNGIKNLYFIANESRLMDSKPAKTDITNIHCAFTDHDPDADKDYKTGRASVLTAAQSLANGELPPSVIIDSGHGINALWRFDEALTNVEEFEAINKPFSELTGGKGIYNADRLLRLPGTTNLITDTKRKKGYPASPTQARVLFRSDATYSVNDIRAFIVRNCSRANGHADSIVPNKKMLLYADIMSRWLGDKSGLNDKTRSGMDMSLGALLKARGFSFEDTCAILLRFPYGKGPDNNARQLRRIWDRSTAEAPFTVNREDADPGPFLASELTGTAPEREWIIENWIAKGVVNSLYGAGGVGKTLLAQQLAYCLGIGKPFLGINAPQKTVLCVFCEDDRDELHRRHDCLKNGLDLPIGNPFDRVWLWPRIGQDNLLVTWDANGRVFEGPAFKSVESVVLDKKPDLLILDTLADFFGGNEIMRPQVNHFLKTLLGGLIVRAAKDGWCLTVLLLAHPSAAGLTTGTGLSGSTAWENAVRARLYMRKPEDGHQDERELVRAKANYTSAGEEDAMRLLWRGGFFVRISAEEVELQSAQKQISDAVRAAWMNGSAYTSKRGHERCIWRTLPHKLKHIKLEVCLKALRRMIEDGTIVISRRGRGGTVKGFKVAEEGDFEEEG